MVANHTTKLNTKKRKRYVSVYDFVAGMPTWCVVDQYGEHVAGFMGDGSQGFAREHAFILNAREEDRVNAKP